MTQVEKKAQPYRPTLYQFVRTRRNQKSTLKLHVTATDPQYGISSVWGSSLSPCGPQPYPLTKPHYSLLLCTFLLVSAKFTFLSSRHSFTDSIHFFFGLSVGRFPKHTHTH